METIHVAIITMRVKHCEGAYIQAGWEFFVVNELFSVHVAIF